MNHREIVIQEEAFEDLQQGRRFYEQQELGLGDYFIDALLADLDYLSFYAGIHPLYSGYYRMPSKRFPFSIYYNIDEEFVFVIAILDMRRNPGWNRAELEKRP